MEKKTHVIVASIFLSVLVWLSVSMNNEYSISVKVPLRISNIPDELALGNPVPSTILVRVHGTGWQLAAAYFSTTSSINIDGANLSRQRVILTGRDLGYSLDLGSSAEVLGFTPDTVIITIDTIITKKVPVIARVDVQPKQNFTIVGNLRVAPDSVYITGARRLIDRINSWYTAPKRYRNAAEDIDATLRLSDSLIGVVKVSDQSVELRVDVEQITDNTFRSIPISVLNNRDSVNILLLPPMVDVTVRGGIDLMSEMTADSFGASIDYDDLTRSLSSRFQPAMRVPAGLQLIAVQPDTIEFVIKK